MRREVAAAPPHLSTPLKSPFRTLGRHLYAQRLLDAFGESCEVLECGGHSLLVGSDRPVGGLERKDRLSRLLTHGYQAVVVAKHRKTRAVVLRPLQDHTVVAKHRVTIGRWNLLIHRP